MNRWGTRNFDSYNEGRVCRAVLVGAMWAWPTNVATIYPNLTQVPLVGGSRVALVRREAPPPAELNKSSESICRREPGTKCMRGLSSQRRSPCGRIGFWRPFSWVFLPWSLWLLITPRVKWTGPAQDASASSCLFRIHISLVYFFWEFWSQRRYLCIFLFSCFFFFNAWLMKQYIRIHTWSRTNNSWLIFLTDCSEVKKNW
jgi:hypothetical protein